MESGETAAEDLTMWATLPPEVLNRLLPPTANGAPARPGADWDQFITEIDSFRTLTDDYDGQGAEAPTAATVDSAIELANALRRGRVNPPTVVVPGVTGDVNLEWDLDGGVSVSIEVESPYLAHVFVMSTGQDRAEYWVLEHGVVTCKNRPASPAATPAGPCQ